jgi:hypothetical protein
MRAHILQTNCWVKSMCFSFLTRSGPAQLLLQPTTVQLILAPIFLLITTRQTATFSGNQQTSTQKPRRAREAGYGAQAEGRTPEIPPSELEFNVGVFHTPLVHVQVFNRFLQCMLQIPRSALCDVSRPAGRRLNSEAVGILSGFNAI